MHKSLSPSILQYATWILILELGLAIIVAVILLLREHSLNAFGDWMFWAGLIVLVIGASSVIGGWGITRGGIYQIGQTVGEQNVSSHKKVWRIISDPRGIGRWSIRFYRDVSSS